MTSNRDTRSVSFRHSIGSRITYANVMATIAVFMSLTGLAVAANTIRSSDIVNNTVQSKDIRNGSKGVQSIDIRNDSVGLADISAAAESSFVTPPQAFNLAPDTSAIAVSSGTVYTDSLVLSKPTKLMVIGRLVGSITCGAGGACFQKYGVFVDGTPIEGSAQYQTGSVSSTSGPTGFTLIGITSELAAGSHTLTIQRGDLDPDWSGATTISPHIAAIAVTS